MGNEDLRHRFGVIDDIDHKRADHLVPGDDGRERPIRRWPEQPTPAEAGGEYRRNQQSLD
jgi:hypothetical protein